MILISQYLKENSIYLREQNVKFIIRWNVWLKLDVKKSTLSEELTKK